MAGLYAESFENCDLTAKGWGSGTGRSTTTGRFDTNAQTIASGGNYFGVTFTNSATVICGFAFNCTTPAVDKVIWRLYDTATLHIDVRLTNTGLIKITRNGTALGTGTIAVVSGAWTYFELKVKIDDTTGTVDTWINGSADLALTAQDTRNGGNAQVNLFELTSGTGTCAFDDIYIIDTTGASNNSRLGDVRVESILPTGNGNSSQFVGSDANSTDNYLLVDETSPNGDTDYVESSTVGNKDTYAFHDLTPGTGTVFFVQPCPYVRKSDAGTRSIVSVARVSATEVDSAVETLSATYLHFRDIRDTKPGGGAWTIADVNSAEFGIKVNA